MPKIGKYEILEQLGSGSMGTVYKARDTLLDRICAVKTIRTGVNVELEAKERFYREARTCARLHHPHIITVYDMGEENTTAFIAMELLTGSDLRHIIERRDQIPITVKLQAMAQVCEALAFAHREGIIHRDVKPSNIFLLKDGRAKILDFGIAKLPMSHLTAAGAILGTPNYMAPEQISGAPCDGRSDLFSAAIVFFELLVYQHPFQAPLIPKRVLEGQHDSLLQHDPSLPRPLEKIFNRALSRQPEQRYNTGDELAADIRSVLDAMANNASPTFSRVELPSARSNLPFVPVPPKIEQAADPQEVRLQQMLRVLPSFEAALEKNDGTAARRAFAELSAIGGSDPRFREALEKCRARLAGVGVATAPSGTGVSTASRNPTPTPSDPKSSLMKACPACHGLNKPAAMFCLNCGISFNRPAPSVAPPEYAAKKPGISKVVPRTGLTRDQMRLVFVAAGLVVCLLVLVLAPMLFRRIPQEASVATAHVASPQATVFVGPGEKEKAVTSLNRGDLVNVLALPKSREQEWVRVQSKAGGKLQRPGFIKFEELADWDAKDADGALALARALAPSGSASDQDIRAQIDRLNAVAAKYLGKPAAGTASLDVARLELLLARRAKEANQPADVWQGALTALSTRLSFLRTDPAIQSGVDAIQDQIKKLMAEPQPSPPAIVPAPAVASKVVTPRVQPPNQPPNQPPAQTAGQIPSPGAAQFKMWLAEAERLRKEHRYTDAKGFVARVLHYQPANPDAIGLLKKIDAAIELEKSLNQ